MPEKNVLIVTSKLQVFTALRDVVNQLKGLVEMGLDVKSVTDCLSLKTPYDVIVWDYLEKTSLIPFIKMAASKYPRAKMLTIHGNDDVRQEHMLAGCSYAETPKNAEKMLFELLTESSTAAVA